MATRGTVNLGTVGFGLEANTSSLAASLRTLRAFGQQLDAMSNTSGWADPMVKKFTQIERILSGIHAQVGRTTQRMREAGVAAAEIDKLEAAYRRLSRTMTHQASSMTPAEMNRGIGGMRALLSQGNRMASSQEADKWATNIRNVERAAILAVGPLSGVGARLAVLSALFDSTGAKMTIFIAGMTGVVAGFAVMSVAAVRATMDMERFDAQLTASTGAAQLTAQEYEHVMKTANALGQNVRTLVEPYAKFTTAARLSNLSLEDQRLIFEGATKAGTAMKLSNERMNLVFLALEQMVSKGTVSMEELRRQLGDLLPGSMALAAQSMGKTESELIKMVEAGEVMAGDLLPKLAERWIQVFGPAAAKAAQNLLAEQNRVSTGLFEMLKAFDKAARVSEAWRNILIATQNVLNFMTRNMYEVVAALGALATGTATYLLLLVNWGNAVRAITAAYVSLRAAIMAADVAAATTVVGKLVTSLARVGLVAAGAAAGWFAMKGAQDTTLEGIEKWVKATDEQIQIQQQLGSSHRQTTEMLKQGTATRLRAALAEAAALQATADARLAIERKRFSHLPADRQPDFSQHPMQQQADAAKALADKLIIQLQQLNALKLDPLPGADTSGGTQFQNWIKGIQQSLREVEGLGEQIKANDFGKDAMTKAEAMAKAIEKMADMPGKKKGGLEAISKQLADAGFNGANLTEQLAALYTLIEQRKETIKGMERFPEIFDNAADAASKMFDELKARKDAALAADPAQLASQKQLADKLVDLRKHYTAMKLDQDTINRLVEEYARLWGETERIEANSKAVKQLRQEMEQLENQMGTPHEKATEQYIDRLRKIGDAELKGVRTTEQANALRVRAQDDMYKHMIDNSTLFGRSMNELFRDLERGMSRTLAQMAMGQKATFRDLLDTILQQILEFMIQVQFIQPIMKGLFGGLYTGKAGDAGTGVLEGVLGGIGANMFKNMNPNGYMGSAEGLGAGVMGGFDNAAVANFNYMGAFATGGGFTVGGNGGIDSQLVAFHATPGESVSVGGGGGGGVTVNVINQSGVPVSAESSAPRMDAGQMVVDVLLKRLARDAGAREMLKAQMGPTRF